MLQNLLVCPTVMLLCTTMPQACFAFSLLVRQLVLQCLFQSVMEGVEDYSV